MQKLLVNYVNCRGIILYYTRVSVPSFELATLSPSSECVLPPLGTKGGGGQHLLTGELVRGANSDDWRESLALCAGIL